MIRKIDEPGNLVKWLAISLFCLTLLGTMYLTGANSARAATIKEDISMAENRQYTEKDLRGPTGFSFDGTVTLNIDGASVAVPVSAIGQVNWDGKGKAPSATRTFNFGGAVILKQVAEGEYQVNPDGTGTARFLVTTQEVIGNLPPGVQLPAQAVETFAFVITQPDNQLQFIGTGLLDKDTGEPLAAVTVHGVLRSQR
jgi:hypothetical protein